MTTCMNMYCKKYVRVCALNKSILQACTNTPYPHKRCRSINAYTQHSDIPAMLYTDTISDWQSYACTTIVLHITHSNSPRAWSASSCFLFEIMLQAELISCSAYSAKDREDLGVHRGITVRFQKQVLMYPIMSTSCGTSSSRRTKPAITPFEVVKKCQVQYQGWGSCTRGFAAAETATSMAAPRPWPRRSTYQG